MHGGTHDASNLALTCHRCNERKGTNLTGRDPHTGKIVRKWPLLDVLDPFKRPGSELCNVGPFLAPPNFFYLGTKSLRDIISSLGRNRC